jgi:hypothetical protein
MLFQHAIHWPSLLSEGRIFGQIAQNRLQKYFLAGKNGGRKTSDFFPKAAENRPENILDKFMRETSIL